MIKMTKEEQIQALELARNDLDKQFGKGTTLMGNEKVETEIICSTGSFNIDMALGVMGIPSGRMMEIYGPESSGKTTFCLHVIREAQKKDLRCAFIDTEHALDLSWARKIGVNTNELLISQPMCGEEALEILERLVDSKVMSIIIVDSIAALTPRSEIEAEMGQAMMGAQARLMGQAMRKLTAKISKANCAVIFTNQLRQKLGVMYGSNEVTTSGNAMKFFAAIRLDIRRLKAESSVDDIGGQTVAGIKVKVIKNKIATPFKVAEVDLDTGKDGIYGFNQFKEVFEVATKYEIIKKAGTWYSINEERIGQGKDNAALYLKEHNDVFLDIKRQVMELFNVYNDDTALQGSFSQTIASEQEDANKPKQRKPRKEKEFQGEMEEIKSIDEPIASTEEVVE